MNIFLKILLFLLLFSILLVSLLTLSNVRALNANKSCKNVPDFVPGVYHKTLHIPLINIDIDVTGTFLQDGELDVRIKFGAKDRTYKNRWLYDKPNCRLILQYDPEILSNIASFAGSTLDTEVQIDTNGSLIMNASVYGLLPLKVNVPKVG